MVVFGRQCSESVWNNLLIDIAEEPHSLYSIDLVEFEKLGEEYRTNISREGKVLYESDS